MWGELKVMFHLMQKEGDGKEGRRKEGRKGKEREGRAVSYTHLTLPTS